MGISEDAEPIPVYSAFGGLAIYRTSNIRDCRYSSTLDCEQVAFLAEKTAKGHNKHYVNPYLWIHYYPTS